MHCLHWCGTLPVQAIEHAFKNETVGLVTREQFVEKRLTIEERLKEEEKKRRHEVEEEALRVGGRCWARHGLLVVVAR